MTHYDFAQQAQEAADRLRTQRQNHDRPGQARSLLRLGNLAMNAADYAAALEYLHEAEDLARALDDHHLLRSAIGQISGVHLERKDHSAALAGAEQVLRMTSSEEPAFDQLLALNPLGCVLVAAGRHAEGMAKLQQAHAWIDRLGDLPPARQAHYRAQSLADLSAGHLAGGEHATALACAREGEAVARAFENQPLVQLNLRYIALALLASGDAAAALADLDASRDLAERMGLKAQLGMLQAERSQALEQLGNFPEALDALRASQRIAAEARLEDAARLTEFRRIGEGITQARRDAEAARQVLFAVLPAPIARRIEAGERRIADELPEVSVLFADLVGFTPLAHGMPPAELLTHLDQIFSRFDALTVAAGLEKVKTIGDAYMVIGGAPLPQPDHLRRMVRLGLAMLSALTELRQAMGLDLQMRIGLHMGPVVAGVIGTERLSYDLWGETVNVASRLESAGLPGTLHVRADVAACAGPAFAWQPRGRVALKGVGETPTCLLWADTAQPA